MFQLFGLVLATMLAVSYAAPAGSCTVNGKTINDGETFGAPGIPNKCIKYKCSKGQTSLAEEGCEYDKKCYKIDSTFTKDCTTYKCSKSVKDGVSTYSVSIDKIQCKDANNKCRNAGDSFPYKIKELVWKNCTCAVNGNSVSYSCKG